MNKQPRTMQAIDSSFRDPAGFMVEHDGKIYRCITDKGIGDYNLLKSSGCYDQLVGEGLLVEHKELKNPPKGLVTPPNVQLVIQPRTIPVISYPYEWSFSQLKDAALLTLRIQKIALKHGLYLKDASAYNVQFVGCQPVFIDTLSFEPFNGQPWAGYRQFCQFFLGPLLLMSKQDIRLSALLREYIDGVPLDLTAKLLPTRSRLKPSAYLHIISHAKLQQRLSGDSRNATRVNRRHLSKTAALALAENLERTIKKLRLPKGTSTEWGEYYSFTNYSDKSFAVKKRLVKEFLAEAAGKTRQATLWDLGGNDGTFTKLGAEAGFSEMVCCDIDPVAVERSYLTYKSSKEVYREKLLPIIVDLTNPSPALGWAHRERDSLEQRCAKKPATIMALAIIHHLAISNNLPFDKIARYFSQLGEQLIIEFVPKEDSKVQILLATREDIFPHYDKKSFEDTFSAYYRIVKSTNIKGTKRTLYLMRRK